MELVPVPLVPTCATKWVYKAVESLNIKRSSGYFEKAEMGSHFLDPRISKRTLKEAGLI